VTSIAYTLFGEPLPMPRARIGRGRAYAPPLRIREAKERHAEAVSLSRPSGWSLEGSFALYVVCYRGTRRKCDGDNLQKLVADSLIGLAYADDSMVDVWHCEKRIDRDDPRTEVRVVRLDATEGAR
jgi:Holliday junction resolvase RusA-like endonuclease